VVRVVVHVTDPGPQKWAGVLKSVQNLIKEFDAEIEVEVVTHGEGIGLGLRGSPQLRQVRELLDQGVVIAACANTLHARNIGPEGLIDGVVVVSSGVGEVVRKQVEGWIYLRP